MTESLVGVETFSKPSPKIDSHREIVQLNHRLIIRRVAYVSGRTIECRDRWRPLLLTQFINASAVGHYEMTDDRRRRTAETTFRRCRVDASINRPFAAAPAHDVPLCPGHGAVKFGPLTRRIADKSYRRHFASNRRLPSDWSCTPRRCSAPEKSAKQTIVIIWILADEPIFLRAVERLKAKKY